MAQSTATRSGPIAVAHPSLAHEDFDFPDLPPWPKDEPIAPLLRLSLRELINDDAQEVERFWRAACDVGFFYLDLRGATADSKNDSAHDLPGELAKDGSVDGEGLLRDVEALFKLAPKVFALPDDEKEKYDYQKRGSYNSGYKGLGKGIVDAKGTKDRNEFWNISKDDILGFGERAPNPDILQDETNRTLLKGFISQSEAIIRLLFSRLNDKLELPSKSLENLHRIDRPSGNQIRWIKSPPQPMDDRGKSIGEHTDFGSLTVLFNQLGGLQLLLPDSTQWVYVKPLKGHCVCNLGDAMVTFTAGILRSNVHRVINPPGEQSDSTRFSLGYFGKPEDDVMMKVLEGSEVIDKARSQQGEPNGEQYETAKDWIYRRAVGKRVGGDWSKSLGTEGDRLSKD